MTAADIQTQFDDAPCVTQLMGGQWSQLEVILLWKILNGDVPMSAADIQDLLNASPCVANLLPGQKQQLIIELLWEWLQGGGGGGGAVAIEGDNFCFSGAAPNQVLKIKNADTGLANEILTVGLDPNPTVSFENGSAC